ncbi:MAG: tRNA glutamyl-Q(34) synthetase GluQRS [Candidatus Aphodousia sp.]|nr:tRNA glutamyl-Q(34) synthetase GluQRS [Candidatus Aphodousia sp.]
MTNYIGRFAPSPTGVLHAGSLAAALASFLDARAHDGRWLIRIEDVDTTRCKAEYTRAILKTLDQLHMVSDGPVIVQTDRLDRYREVFQSLLDKGFIYGCGCSRLSIQKTIQEHHLAPHRYPGTCRKETVGPIRAWRFKTENRTIGFQDRWFAHYEQNVFRDVGDFVIKRADGLFAYQLAVIVDDHDSGVNHIVRGADLIDNTPRQIAIHEALGWDCPSYMHIPLVLNNRGEKLSKQAGAQALSDDLLKELESVWQHLGFPRLGADTIDAFYTGAISMWQERFK